MPVSEYGEIGRLVKFYPDRDYVIIWAVRGVKDVDGKPAYLTSMGWIRGLPEAYFSPTARERSLRPCIQRAIKYIEGKYPGKSASTH